MLRILLSIGLCLLMPTAVLAQRIFLKELVVIPVRPIDANTFEAFENDGAGASQVWCAAGKFTRDYLRQRGGELYVLQARGDSAAVPGRKSVIFTTQPVANPVKSYSVSLRKEGLNFSMTHAYALCRSQPEFLIRVRVVGS